MKMLKKQNILEFLLTNNEILKIIFHDKSFSIQAKDSDIFIEGISLQKILDCIIQERLLIASQEEKQKNNELIDRYFIMYK